MKKRTKADEERPEAIFDLYAAKLNETIFGL
jgi:hypothetical protein